MNWGLVKMTIKCVKFLDFDIVLCLCKILFLFLGVTHSSIQGQQGTMSATYTKIVKNKNKYVCI